MSAAQILRTLICVFSKAITGVRAFWADNEPVSRQSVFFANHRSHVDFVLIWASLPGELRLHTHPVAGRDYWERNAFLQYLAKKVFCSVLIDRTPKLHGPNPIEQMSAVLKQGDSLIIFPEGTRNLDDDLQTFKGGIYHLAKANPEIDFVPVWIENLGRVMPKGKLIPVPLLCSLSFGRHINLFPGESKEDFLGRAQAALNTLAPKHD